MTILSAPPPGWVSPEKPRSLSRRLLALLQLPDPIRVSDEREREQIREAWRNELPALVEDLFWRAAMVLDTAEVRKIFWRAGKRATAGRPPKLARAAFIADLNTALDETEPDATNRVARLADDLLRFGENRGDYF